MSKGQVAGIDGDQCAQWQGESAWLWDLPLGETHATLILAHGAGAPMDSEFMKSMAQSLAARGIAVLRFEFAYMAARRLDGKKRPPQSPGQAARTVARGIPPGAPTGRRAIGHRRQIHGWAYGQSAGR